MAIFVEGKTETYFAKKLVEEIGGRKKLAVISKELHGDVAHCSRVIHQVTATNIANTAAYYVLVLDCGNDDKVVSDIGAHYQKLVSSGYSIIVGIRDVYPIKREDIEKLRRNMGYMIPTKPILVQYVLGVMEVECWFLSEHTHFERISGALNPDRIRDKLGFDVRVDDMQLRGKPADDLHAAYAIEKLAYTKRAKNIQRTVNALDYAEVYLSVKDRVPDLGRLIRVIDGFFTD